MKKNPFLFFGALLVLVFFSLCFSGSVRAEDSLLKIQAIPDQNSVKSGMMFLIHVQVTNSSSDASADFWSNSCSYEKHWVTDNAGVFIQSWTCNENTLEQITLEPGDVYEKNIILYIPKKDKTEPVTFRLGFKRMSENGDVAEPLWSDPVTMDVIVPEEMKEATPLVVADVAAQTPDHVPGTSTEMNETPPAVVSDSAVPAGSQPLVFQDPGVPITVQPGDEFSITLTSNPSTGFRWKMTLPEDQKTVKLLGSAHVASHEVMPGVPGEEVYKFKAMTPGEIKVDFVYERPWEPKAAPTRKIFTILVQEN
ncbi:MAG: hypothetical protein A2351_01960 [Omnitrophica bacterium RIFOXYB12_FULL_50_7]|nr:MAG: hypothetical protein A2351_01960 [Omnitrophica bacterium RIFOXYB12_FULL_50_7]